MGRHKEQQVNAHSPTVLKLGRLLPGREDVRTCITRSTTAKRHTQRHTHLGYSRPVCNLKRAAVLAPAVFVGVRTPHLLHAWDLKTRLCTEHNTVGQHSVLTCMSPNGNVAHDLSMQPQVAVTICECYAVISMQPGFACSTAPQPP